MKAAADTASDAQLNNAKIVRTECPPTPVCTIAGRGNVVIASGAIGDNDLRTLSAFKALAENHCARKPIPDVYGAELDYRCNVLDCAVNWHDIQVPIPEVPLKKVAKTIPE